MRHLDEGLLRAYCDGALSEVEVERVRVHLGTCPRCARKASAVQERGARVGAWLAGLDPQSAREPVASQVARHRLDGYLSQKREHNMAGNVFSRRYRLAWVAAAVVMVLVVPLAFSPVRAVANNLLALFRVQKIEFVEVDPESFPDDDLLQEAARRFESVVEDQVVIEGGGEPQVVDEATARSLAAFPVRLPTALEEEPHITIEPGAHVAMQVDLPRIRALLSELGYGETALPDSLDGADIAIDFGTSVAATYGTCEQGSDQWGTAQGPGDYQGECTVWMQLPVPTVSAPPELDLDQLGMAYLQLLGLSAEEAERFSERVDWTTTLVVPIPRSANLQQQEVDVDGVTGALIRPPRSRMNQDEYVLTWVKDGVVYALIGSGELETALEIAGSLE
jgi:hypothetical protein